MTILESILNEPLEIDNQLILSLISFIDLTTLNNTDTREVVSQLSDKANRGFQDTFPAAVCVFSGFGDTVRQQLQSQIKTAVVGGCFPTGQTLSSAKVDEVAHIAQTGADEIDVVLNRGDFLEGKYDKIKAEIAGMKQAAGKRHLKVILETGELATAHHIQKASEVAIAGGADFIKTSTGKTAIGATPEAVFVMCNVIKDHFQETGKKIGIKPSGGIRTLEDAIIYYKIVSAVLGESWLNNTLFRIGASSLYDNLIKAYK